MRLVELNPEWWRVGRDQRKHGGRRYYERVETMAEAEGIQFLCPKCFVENRGPVGTHIVICWRPVVGAEIAPGPGRWEFEGTGFENLSLVAGSSSVLLEGGCCAHFWVKRGEIVMAS